MPDEDDKERVDRELIELLNELRVALPGVQVLFAFLLILLQASIRNAQIKAIAHGGWPRECCGDNDCQPIKTGAPQKIPGGYLLKDGRTVPDSKVRYDGVQHDDHWYLCEAAPWVRADKHIYCLFPPPGGV